MSQQQSQNQAQKQPQLIDGFNRHVNYVRISVTDRCDFRCVYCMAEEMTFLPRKEILSLEEIHQVAEAFVSLGVDKIRLTGGEPLVRNNVISLFNSIGHLPGLRELTFTSNGSRVAKYAEQLWQAGVRRINISLDSLQPDRFQSITRSGNLDTVLNSILVARKTGFDIKLNSVILNGRNDDEIIDLVNFARDHELDITFIEEMPLGSIVEHNRALTFCSSDQVHNTISRHHTLTPTSLTTGGPSRYYSMADSAIKVGFISPHSHNFCGDCNRVRVTVEGRLLLCLGNEHSVDLRRTLREKPGDINALREQIRNAMTIKPERHYFDLDDEPQVLRFMNMTGG